MQVFWEHGYEGTSMSHLSEAMGLTSTSIYAAFESKEILFQEAVRLYVSSDGRASWQALQQPGDMRTILTNMLKETVKTFCRADTPRGCLIMLGDKGLGRGHASVREYLREQRDRLRKALQVRIKQAVKAGDLPQDTDIATSASLVLVFLNGISIETADGISEARLIKSVDAVMAHWPVSTKNG